MRIKAAALLAQVCLAIGAPERAEELARQAMADVDRTGLRGYPITWHAPVALGRVLLQQGQLREAETVLVEVLEPLFAALRTTPLAYAEALLTLAVVRAARGQPEAARTGLEEARAALRGCRDAGMLPGFLAEAERGLGRQAQRPAGLREALSEGELRILRLLATHLSQREIGRELYLSVNTVKSHTRNIYGKLDAASRSEAVARARSLHLIA